jgi:hypothetical protein
LWLIVCLVGLGLALAAYQQQRRGGIEVAEAPRDAAEDRAPETGAGPAPAEDRSADADTDVATAPGPAPKEPSARGPDAGLADVPPASDRGTAPPAEGERLATLDQQRSDDPTSSSELRTGPAAARSGPEERSMPRESEDSSGSAPSGVAEVPAPPSEKERVAAAPTDRPGLDPATPPASSEPLAAGGEPAAPPSSEQQRAAIAEKSGDEPQPGLGSLTTDTIRRALSALLDRLPGEPSAPEAPSGQEGGLAGVKPPVTESPSEPRMAAVEPEEKAAPKAVAPSFDLVRVQRGGQMVVAGRAAPGAEVELRAGGEVIDRVRADLRGQWVSVPLRRLPAGDRELSLAARSGDALPVESEQVVVLAVPGDETAPDRADHPAATSVALEEPGQKALAVLLPRDGGGRGRVLQAPGRIGSDGQLALLMLDYDDTGQIRLSGEASPGATVRVYVDNELYGEARVGEDGAWTCALDRPLAPGSYTLRVDQLNSAGQAVARLETPFTRVAQPPVQGDALVDYVIVQPGNSLWRIARRLLGNGFEYVHIYEANHAQIRDPDLIYPGQVFEIPIGVADG